MTTNGVSAATGTASRVAYDRFLREQMFARLRVGSLLVAVLVPFGFVFDLVVYPQHVWEFLAIRLGASAVGVILFLVASSPGSKRHAFTLSVVLSLSAAGAIEGMVAIAGAHDSPYYAGLNLVILGVGLLFPWRMRQMLLVCASIYAMYLLPVAFDLGSVRWAEFANNNYFLFLTAVIAVVSSHFASRLREREFHARKDLETRTDELRETSGKLRTSLEKLQELDHIKSQFFANVSHELRTPLTLILSPLETLLQDDMGQPAGAVREQLEAMHRNASRLLRLINNLLDLSRIEAGKVYLRYEPLDLHAFLGTLIAPFATLAQRKKIHLTLESGSVEPVLVDVERMEIVFQNLVANALKFTSPGGQVSLRVRTESGYVVAEVEDTGIGIAPKDLPVIFDRFAQADGSTTRRFGGTGIGLSLVKELVELHGGDVFADSTPGTGSTFTVRLPLGEGHVRDELRERRAEDVPVVRDRRESNRDPVASLMPKPVPVWDEEALQPQGIDDGPAASPGAPRVLVVEDNADMRDFLRRLLRPHFRVLGAADGQEGLERALAEQPDLVLSDVMMPRLSGYDLTRALREDPATRAIPIILLTAKGGLPPKLEAFAIGADDFVAKPFSAQELLARINVQLRLQEMGRQLAQAEKMSMLGTLTAGLAHEIRNPINYIVNSVPVIRKRIAEADSDSAASTLLDTIEEGAMRIDGIVADLLSFSHLDQASVKEWKVAEGLVATLKLLAPRLDGITVHQELSFDGWVEGQPGALNQVMMNLLDNAARAAAPEGEVWVSARRDGDGVLLEVRDSGPGIDPEVAPRIFNPFFTTRPPGQGTGLGLHLCRQIVEAHGGRIEVDSRPGRGARFTVWLPERASRREAG